MVWRNPNMDMQVGDTSLEAWSSRRRAESLQRLGGCAIVTTFLMIVEVSVGVYVDSLSLTSNGFHLLTDVAMYSSLYVAVRESNRAADRKSFSFGLHRLEVVGVLVALIAQYIITANLLFSALRHLLNPSQLSSQAGQIICLTATGSLIVNSCLAFWVGKTCNVHSHSHVHGGMASRMAWLHLVSDAAQNSLVIITGGLLWIDPNLSQLDRFCTLAFGGLVIGSTLGLMRQLLGIVMERAPEDLDCERMYTDLEGITGVVGVHCCHAWSISQGKIAMSAHMHVDSGMQEDVLQHALIILKHRYGLYHVTLQISDDEDLA
jgi:cation diffusion facilitator family transporter